MRTIRLDITCTPTACETRRGWCQFLAEASFGEGWYCCAFDQIDAGRLATDADGVPQRCAACLAAEVQK
jgi:hypothetical protein